MREKTPKLTLNFVVALSWFIKSGTVAPRIRRVATAIDAHLSKTNTFFHEISYHLVLSSLLDSTPLSCMTQRFNA